MTTIISLNKDARGFANIYQGSPQPYNRIDLFLANAFDKENDNRHAEAIAIYQQVHENLKIHRPGANTEIDRIRKLIEDRIKDLRIANLEILLRAAQGQHEIDQRHIQSLQNQNQSLQKQLEQQAHMHLDAAVKMHEENNGLKADLLLVSQDNGELRDKVANLTFRADNSEAVIVTTKRHEESKEQTSPLISPQKSWVKSVGSVNAVHQQKPVSFVQHC